MICGLSLICSFLQVTLAIDEPEPGLTVVKLTHVDIPEEDRLALSFLVFLVVVCL